MIGTLRETELHAALKRHFARPKINWRSRSMATSPTSCATTK